MSFDLYHERMYQGNYEDEKMFGKCDATVLKTYHPCLPISEIFHTIIYTLTICFRQCNF